MYLQGTKQIKVEDFIVLSFSLWSMALFWWYEGHRYSWMYPEWHGQSLTEKMETIYWEREYRRVNLKHVDFEVLGYRCRGFKIWIGFIIPYVWVNIGYLFFFFWLTSLCIRDSRFIHFTAREQTWVHSEGMWGWNELRK